MKTKYARKDFNAAHQVCFANLRTLRGKPRGVLTRVISTKIKKRVPIALFLGFGGDKGIRTPDLCVANASLYQLSHIPAASLAIIAKVKTFVKYFP